MSDFHPETWNPMWSVSTILTGLYSFMIETASTLGSIETSDAVKRKLALHSLEFNVKDTTFCKLFPELVEVYKERQKLRNIGSSGIPSSSVTSSLSSSAVAGFKGDVMEDEMRGLMAIAAGAVALLSLLFALRFF